MRSAAPSVDASGGTDAAAGLRDTLLRHYDRNRRRLPWRDEADPYRVLVSEVMLQQTRVETVERYYGRWLEQFPDLATLAAAEEGSVLKAWEGLGYYRRARSLHRAACLVRADADAELPTSYDELRRLPGLGEYTAGAVASIAFGERVPAVDGNVRRVLARLFDTSDPKPTWLRRAAARLVDPDRPGDWNQALMDLGSTVCTPRSPRCDACPLTRWCRAWAAGTVAERPRPAARASPRKATFALSLLHDGERVLLQKRPAEGLLGGMWAFPEREVPAACAEGMSPDRAEEAALALGAALGATLVGRPERCRPHEHRFTHMQATYLPYVVPVRPGRPEGAGLAWIEPGAPTGHPLPVVPRRILEELSARGGPSRAD